MLELWHHQREDFVSVSNKITFFKGIFHVLLGNTQNSTEQSHTPGIFLMPKKNMWKGKPQKNQFADSNPINQAWETQTGQTQWNRRRGIHRNSERRGSQKLQEKASFDVLFIFIYCILNKWKCTLQILIRRIRISWIKERNYSCSNFAILSLDFSNASTFLPIPMPGTHTHQC